MTLEDYIAVSVFSWPSLYYYGDYSKSRRAVLCQLFLTTGNGIYYTNPDNVAGMGSFGNDGRVPLSDAYKKRLIEGAKIVIIYEDVDRDLFKKLGMLFPNRDELKVQFYDDFLREGKKFLNLTTAKDTLGFDKENRRFLGNIDDYECFIRIFPDDNRVFDNGGWHPYPFSIEYTPFWDRQNKCLIPAEMIADDWRQGIIEIYTELLKWMEDDECWCSDNYYNWAEDKKLGVFQDNWDKQPDKLKLCKDYEIPPVEYTDVREMARAIVKYQRAKRISECKQILKHFCYEMETS